MENLRGTHRVPKNEAIVANLIDEMISGSEISAWSWVEWMDIGLDRMELGRRHDGDVFLSIGDFSPLV